jgi:hypothetical protein
MGEEEEEEEFLLGSLRDLIEYCGVTIYTG